MPKNVAPVPCPECGGPMWNNAFDPKRKASQPHFRCKDRKNCDGAIWLKKDELAALERQGTSTALPAEVLVLDAMMYRCHESAIASCRKLYGPDVAVEIIAASAHSLFIARIGRGGVLLRETRIADRAAKEAAKKASAPAIPLPKGPAYAGLNGDSDLPF